MSPPHKMLSVKPWINWTRQGLWDEAARLTIANNEQAQTIRHLRNRISHFIAEVNSLEKLLAKCGEQGGDRCPSCKDYPNDVCLEDNCYGGWIVEVPE